MEKLQFTVLTYNVLYDIDKKNPKHHKFETQKVVDAIKDCDADVVCLQETNENWENTLREKLGETYPIQKYLHHGKIGSAILLKKNMQYQDYKTYQLKDPESWFPVQFMTLIFNDTRYNLANVHLAPLKSKHGFFSSIYYYFYESYIVRLKEIKEIIGIQSLDIICGDFNESSHGYVTAELKMNGFEDSVTMCSDPTTWVWPWYFGIYFWSSLDHCFYGPRLSAIGCTIHTKYTSASDHLPVLTTFKIN